MGRIHSERYRIQSAWYRMDRLHSARYRIQSARYRIQLVLVTEFYLSDNIT